MEGLQRTLAAGHPLDSLSAQESTDVTSTLRACEDFRALSERTRFVTIPLREPPKDAILAWAGGAAPPRREAEAVILDRRAECSIEAVVHSPRTRSSRGRGGRTSSRCVAFLKPRPGDNEWAHPIDGVIAFVDVNRLEVSPATRGLADHAGHRRRLKLKPVGFFERNPALDVPPSEPHSDRCDPEETNEHC